MSCLYTLSVLCNYSNVMLFFLSFTQFELIAITMIVDCSAYSSYTYSYLIPRKLSQASILQQLPNYNQHYLWHSSISLYLDIIESETMSWTFTSWSTNKSIFTFCWVSKYTEIYIIIWSKLCYYCFLLLLLIFTSHV